MFGPIFCIGNTNRNIISWILIEVVADFPMLTESIFKNYFIVLCMQQNKCTTVFFTERGIQIFDNVEHAKYTAEYYNLWR